MHHQEASPMEKKLSVLGIDIAKQVFHLVGMNDHGTILLRKRLYRAQVMTFIAQLAPTLIGMEACGGAHYWARRLRWAAPFWQAVAPPATRRDDPDSLYGTLVWHLAWAGRAPAASHAVSVLEPRAPPREGLAHGQPLQLCDAAQEPASRSHIAYPSDGPRADRPCLELWRV